MARIALRTASEIEQERRAFKADRHGHNNQGTKFMSRLTYMAHAGGYVMTRRPGCTPFLISEKLWRSFQTWDPAQHADARGAP